ncbi:S8 family peptidase [Bacteriovorax sp. DB6_IX]|uniref:S8 family peptidase n=1 Tax=Bacteriovorax sp. DB6_IX TaxID=1353530 RepID=UPI000389E840|nr:S8 family peptidase [Bacteriovorax sp. DB6_IX]EQC51565.1 peptidase, S8/S53 family [Bacteriovorax sp. DB6_IX]
MKNLNAIKSKLLPFIALTAISGLARADYLVMVKDQGLVNHFEKEEFVGNFPHATFKVNNLSSLLPYSLDDSAFVIDKNFEISLSSTPTDPYMEVQWGIQNLGNNEPRRGGGRIPIPGVVGSDINILDVWRNNPGKKDVIVAVVDTGVDYKHEDLKESMWTNQAELNGLRGVDDDGNGYVDDIYGYNFSKNTSDPMDDNHHGTHVSGIIGAQHNSVGVAGVIQNANIMAVKFMDKKGRGDLEKALKATKYAVENGATVINNSWGSLGHSEILENYMKDAGKRGVVFVAAAGNNYKNLDESPLYPAAFRIPNQITVAALNPENRMTGFSCYGPLTVHIAAPGRNIISTVPNNKYKVLSGTSMSAPYVAAAVALYKARFPEATPDEIKTKMIETAVHVPHFAGKTFSEGRLDVENFLSP